MPMRGKSVLSLNYTAGLAYRATETYLNSTTVCASTSLPKAVQPSGWSQSYPSTQQDGAASLTAPLSSSRGSGAPQAPRGLDRPQQTAGTGDRQLEQQQQGESSSSTHTSSPSPRHLCFSPPATTSTTENPSSLKGNVCACLFYLFINFHSLIQIYTLPFRPHLGTQGGFQT